MRPPMHHPMRAPSAKRFAALLACALMFLVLSACGDDKKKEERAKGVPSPAVSSQPRGNQREESFKDAKRALERRVYFDHRVTIYCGAAFDAEGNVAPPPGFRVTKHQARAGRIEWEHAVPAENFGRAFAEWREGAPECQDRRGPFKGRKCAERVNPEYRRMQADMYNLYPAIGAVNALRSNYNYSVLPGVPSACGDCPVKIDEGRMEPPPPARGALARSTKYMAWAYAPRLRLSDQQAKLMDAWDAQFPVDAWECERARRIEGVQGNENPFVNGKCQEAGL